MMRLAIFHGEPRVCMRTCICIIFYVSTVQDFHMQCISYFSLDLSCGGVRCRSGTNNSAMFAEIVPEQLRSAVYAFDRSFEGAVGATGAPLVGEYRALLGRGRLAHCFVGASLIV